MKIKKLLQKKNLIFQEVVVNGWVRSFRNNRFIVLNDGSSLKNLQIIVMESNFSKELLKKITIGIALQIKGILNKSTGKKQDAEIISTVIQIYNKVSVSDINKTILQPKRHKLEKLREQAHLRLRTKIFGAIMRIRHQLSFCVHEYFYLQGFFYFHTPIITSLDPEGIGDMFRVTYFRSYNLTDLPIDNQQCIDNSKDFFCRETYLSVSGQLEGETAAISLGKIYTFGPTFRAENSNTLKHLSEFWMIEPEMAFFDIIDNINIAEDLLKSLIIKILKRCKEDIFFLSWKEGTLIERLQLIVNHSFIRISYTEAINILASHKHLVEWGVDIQHESQRYLVEHFCRPIILLDSPAQIKAFYMRFNEDEKTVSSMDILFPIIGEVIGGSQREERYELLLNRMQSFGGGYEKEYWWYLDTRRFGSVLHSGFGLGFDRLVQFITGLLNIRDIIPFPRTPKNAEF